MTLDELRERIKDEVVLHEGNVADYQWRQMGLTDEAAKIGVSGPDFGRLVNQVSLTVAPDLGRIADLKTDILKLAGERRKQFTDADVRQFVDDAERAHLTRSFVVDTWIPTLLRQLPDAPKPAAPEPPPPIPETGPVVPEPVVAAGETADSVRRKVTEILSDYDGHIPAPAIRSLFRAINYNEAELSGLIWNYLQIYQYVPDLELRDGSLRDKLTSTDWRYAIKTQPAPPVSSPGPPPVVRSFTATPARVRRGESVTLAWEVDNLLAVTIDDLGEGLSPNNRGWIKPNKTADYTLFDANNNPLSTVRVEVIPRDNSGLYGVLFALSLLALIYFFVRNNNAKPAPDRKPARPTERTIKRTASAKRVDKRPEPDEDVATDPLPKVPKPAVDEPVTSSAKTNGPDESVAATAEKPGPVRKAQPEPVTKPPTPADARVGKYEEAFGDKPYDKIELGTDEQGWRRARSNGRWGYVDEADEWVIQPQYEAVTPFRGNTAAVFLDGKLLKINRQGEPVKN